jgi:hypothetical protein
VLEDRLPGRRQEETLHPNGGETVA